MKNGILIFAYNNKTVDYLELAIVSARLAKKHLDVPVSLITDAATLTSGDVNNINSVFHKVILTDTPDQNNYRVLNGNNTLFLNSNRWQAWELTPYDRTLVIDSDLLIFSDRLSHYWDVESDFLICDSMIDAFGNSFDIEDQRVSDKSIELRWATAIMFTKNNFTKTIFDTVKYISQEYRYYCDIYGIEARNFRNDIAFSIARHIVCGFQEDTDILPSIMFFNKNSNLVDVTDGLLTFSFNNTEQLAVKGLDVHIMNKLDILKYKECLVT
jgi:hypothetical protein